MRLHISRASRCPTPSTRISVLWWHSARSYKKYTSGKRNSYHSSEGELSLMHTWNKLQKTMVRFLPTHSELVEEPGTLREEWTSSSSTFWELGLRLKLPPDIIEKLQRQYWRYFKHSTPPSLIPVYCIDVWLQEPKNNICWRAWVGNELLAMGVFARWSIRSGSTGVMG